MENRQETMPRRFVSPADLPALDALGIDIALEARGPFDGILAVGDRPAYAGIASGREVGLRFSPAETGLRGCGK